MVRIQDERLAFKPDIYVLSSNRLHVVGDTQLDTDALQAVPKDLSHCIEVPSQLMHVGRCGMPQIVEADDPIEGYPYYNVYPDVTVGTYKDDELNGDTRIYEHNHLSYSGEVKNGEENGYGTWYYENGQAEYEGEIKNGKPNGKGSRYGEDGQLIYSGEWKNGDYAH